MANEIAEWGKLIATARTDAEILALLGPCGYDADELGAGETLQKAADAAYGSRQTAIPSKTLFNFPALA